MNTSTEKPEVKADRPYQEGVEQQVKGQSLGPEGFTAGGGLLNKVTHQLLSPTFFPQITDPERTSN